MHQALPSTDATRRRMGFLTVDETFRLSMQGVLIPDPVSVLVSPGVALGEGAILWPGTILQVSNGGSITVGGGTNLFSGTRMVAAGGRISIGSQTEIGEEGGFTVKADLGIAIEVGDGARLIGGGSLIGPNRIGRGAQILGPIRCQTCTLGDGGTYRDEDPDERGGVLKGSGVARNLDVPQGHVIQAFGLFAEGIMRRQSYFHPKPGS
ncbi:hypothetical protein [Microvirga subterranea]|uniref:Uncharacterized protein n=1 Tax=Microvirga subterranea TaxID=186651 RepID=A0A370H772_9HYPH|nr:hypothetical protein [Microvirga subterranea]RDI52404.1 hypothetical protein DES45_11529 [Microvirga subterranea]